MLPAAMLPMAVLPAAKLPAGPNRRASAQSLRRTAFAGTPVRAGPASGSSGSARVALKVVAGGCPFCADAPVRENGKRCIAICRNPQNVGDPEAGPVQGLPASSAVATQLNALKDNNTPRTNHGLEVMYQFCGDSDGMTRSRYFGASQDIYAMDHFMAAFANACPAFILLESYEITDAQDLSDGRCLVKAEVVEKGRKPGEAVRWSFVMKMQDVGKYKGCWLTHRLLPEGSKFLDWRDGLPV